MTHAQLAARLLREAAGIFRTLGAENDRIQRLDEYAELFDQAADLVEADPQGELQFPSGAGA